jgi:predicted HTH transcriptional regulator
MTSAASLYATAPADITIDLIRGLLQTTPTESLTVEYKQEFTRDLPESVAALANTYGGLILVGVTDGQSADRLVGVVGDVQVQIANACHDSLEPPWVPEMIMVPISDAADSRVILILRVIPRELPARSSSGG